MKTVNIKYEPFPEQIQGKIKSFVRSKRDGKYLIVIDSTRAPIVQRFALGHELAHIFRGHLDDMSIPLTRAEREADRHAWQYYRLYRDGLLKADFHEGS